MKAKLLLAAIVLIAACSKSPSPSPVPPPNGSDTTQKHDTTPAPPHDTTPKPPAPPTETPGVTKISGTLEWEVDFYKGQVQIMDGGGIGTDIEVLDADTAHVSAEIINAYKGTYTIQYAALNGDTTVGFAFSNEDYWTSEAACDSPDTAGIVQIHIYRKDGKNVAPGIKDFYLPLGRASGNVVGQGRMAINSYTGICAKLTLDSLLKFVSAPTTMTLIKADGF